MIKNKLIAEAKKARERAYVPYSKFPVGAALMTESGDIYTGCNIENAAYPVTCCAERVAIFKAISEGHTDINQMAVIADTPRPTSPCGSCRQVMSELFSDDVTIYLANVNGDTLTVTMSELLPLAFDAHDIN